MLSKWLSKPKCDHRWPASVRLSANSGPWRIREMCPLRVRDQPVRMRVQS